MAHFSSITFDLTSLTFILSNSLGRSLRVFKQFSWLEAGSATMALSRPTHQRVTQAVMPCAGEVSR
jgi:hypothetical protein